ncbi:hypothetical protein BH11ARM1_BH11ARM1_16830 [soil metagenome]
MALGTLNFEQLDFTERPIKVRSGLTQIALDQTGKWMATSDAYMHVKVVRNQTALAFERDFNFLDDRIRAVQRIRGLAFSDNAEQLYVLAGDTMYAISTQNGETIWSYSPPRSFGFLVSSPLSVAAQNGVVAASLDNGSMVVWTQDGKLQNRFSHNDSPRYLSLVDDGKTIVGTDGFSIGMWDWQSGRQTSRIRTDQRIYGFAVSSRQRIAAAWTMLGAEIYDLSNGAKISTIKSGPGLPNLALDPVNARIAVAERNGVLVSNFAGDRQTRFEVSDANVISVQFAPDGSQVLVGGTDCAVRSFDL